MIYITGDIDDLKFRDFCDAMFDSEKSSAKVIDIILHSYGGDAFSALAFHDRIKNSNKDVRVTVYGSCMSAAVLILAAGDIRRMTSNSWVMVHEDGVAKLKPQDVTALERYAKHYRRVEDQWDDLLEQNTGTPASTWKVLHKAETYLLAEECLELGLITEII